MRVFIIGASGFTGERVLAACPENWTVGALARSEASASRIEAGGRATTLVGDLDDPASVEAALRGFQPDGVITIASLGFGHADTLVPVIRRVGSARSVFVSTTGIFTKLSPPSKAVRLRAEATINASGLEATILRPTMIYGRPGDRNMERLLRWLHRMPLLAAPGGGRALQQPVHVDDLAAAIVASLTSDAAAGRSIDVPGPAAIPFAQIVREASEAVGRTGRIVPVPIGPLRKLVGLQERLFNDPKLKAEQIDRLVEDKAFDVEPARQLLNHQPRSFAEGILDEARLLGLP